MATLVTLYKVIISGLFVSFKFLSIALSKQMVLIELKQFYFFRRVRNQSLTITIHKVQRR